MPNTEDFFRGLVKIDNGWYLAPIDDPDGKRVARLHSYGLLDTPPEAAFDRISALAAALFATPIALINLADTHRQWFKSCYGLEDVRETPLDHAFCTHALHSDQSVMVVEDASQDARFYNNPLVTGWPNIRFYAGASMISHDGHKIGSLCVIDRVPRADLGDEQKEHLASLAGITMDQIELSLANRKSGRQIERLRSYALRSCDRPRYSHSEQTRANAGTTSLLVAGCDDAFFTLLQECGYVCKHCDEPADMPDIMAERGAHFDAIILGQGSGAMEDACQAARTVRTLQSRRYRKLPIIGLNTRIDRESFERCMQAGMQDVLKTPVAVESLYNCLREYLGAGMPDIMADTRA